MHRFTVTLIVTAKSFADAETIANGAVERADEGYSTYHNECSAVIMQIHKEEESVA